MTAPVEFRLGSITIYSTRSRTGFLDEPFRTPNSLKEAIPARIRLSIPKNKTTY